MFLKIPFRIQERDRGSPTKCLILHQNLGEEAENLVVAAADLEEADDAEMGRLSSNSGYRCYLYIVFVKRLSY